MDREEAKEVLALLEHLKGLTEVDKITSTFIYAFENYSFKHGFDSWCLHGNYKLGGTKSGRLSSSNPNLQQIPSTGTRYAKHIKRCFRPPNGWLLVGADFSSLEDRISALTTRDPNKLKPYVQGYDGHSLRAYAYFRERMGDIEPTVESINSIAEKYPKLRQDSKMPTFALTYMGTWRTLVQNGNFTEEEAKKIEKEYHELYKVSDGWVWNEIEKASRTGYVELAFGLRLRTPVIKQVVVKSQTGLPAVAHKEIKTAGNALGQSYGLLNTRAANDFMQRVWKSKYKYDIKPIAQIHDAIYLVIRNKLDVLQWVNINLIDAMRWNELPAIQHPDVKLEAQLELFYPTWADGYPIPNNLTLRELRKHLEQLDLYRSSPSAT